MGVQMAAKVAPDTGVVMRWFREVVLLDAAWLTLLGAALVVSTDLQFSGPSFYKLAEILACYGLEPQWLAAPFVVAGVSLAVGVLTSRIALRQIGYLFGALASFIFAAGAIAAIRDNPTTPYTGLITYAFTGVLQLTMLRGSVESWVLANAKTGA